MATARNEDARIPFLGIPSDDPPDFLVPDLVEMLSRQFGGNSDWSRLRFFGTPKDNPNPVEQVWRQSVASERRTNA